MLSLTVILFDFIVSQPSTNYPSAIFVFVLLRYVHEKKLKKIPVFFNRVGGTEPQGCIPMAR